MNAGTALNEIRWSKPEHVDRRVDALARRIRHLVKTAPPLTPEQADRLAGIVLAHRQGGGDGAA